MRYALLALALLLAACDEGFDPSAPGGAVFALDGTLRAYADTQRVRVQPLRLRPEDPVSLAFALRSDGPDGVQRWQTRMVPGDDGAPVVLALAALRLRPGATYRLTASDDRGVTVATVSAPDSFAVEFLSTQVDPDLRFVRQSVRLVGAVEGPEEVTVEYVIRASLNAPPVRYERPYPTFLAAGGRFWTAELDQDLRAARREAGVEPNRFIVLDSTFVRYTQRTRGDISQGFGSIEAEATYRSPWTVAPELAPVLRVLRPRLR